ncbi:MAG: NosD domain-containing protein [Thermoleophilia bacterium]
MMSRGHFDIGNRSESTFPSRSLRWDSIFLFVLICFLFAAFEAHADPPPQPPRAAWAIRDDANGGDCAAIGTWDSGSRTCTLTQDLTTDSSGIEICDSGITLDGAGKTLTSTGTNRAIGTGPAYGLSNVTIRNLEITGFNKAFFSERCADCEFSGNHVSDSTLGMEVLSGSNITFTNNVIESCARGLSINETRSGILTGNLLNDNEINLNLPSDPDTIVDTTNLINGKPVYYLVNVSDQIFDSSTNASVFACINCRNVIIRDLSLSQNVTGLMLANTHDSRIENVSASANVSGIAIEDSSGIVVEGNQAVSNSIGINVADSSGSTFEHNNLNANSNRGMSLTGGAENIISSNTASNNSFEGLYIDYSRSNQIDHNIARDNGPQHEYGTGISLRGSVDNTLTANAADDNSQYGISIEPSSSRNTLTENTMTANRANLALGNPDQEINTTNLVDGKPIYNIKNATGTTFDSTTNAGYFSCWHCDDVTIRDLQLSPNAGGISLIDTHNSLIENVNADGSEFPIVLTGSSNNTLIGGSASHGKFHGLSLSASSGNRIFGLAIRENGGLAISLGTSSANSFAGNDISNNNIGFVTSDDSTNNVFYNNSLAAINYETFRLSTGGNYLYNNNIYIGNPDFPFSVTTENTFNLALPAGGNFWSIYNTPEQGCVDLDADHICDDPLVVDWTSRYGTRSQFRDEYPWNIPNGWVQADREPPWVGILKPSGVMDSDAATISATYYDPASGIDAASVNIQLDGVQVHDCEVSEVNVSCPVAGIGYGEHVISVAVADEAGNVSSIAGSFKRSHSYYFPWYDNDPAWGMLGDWIGITNLGNLQAEADIFIGSSEVAVAHLDLSPAGSSGDHTEWISPAVITGGPVEVRSTNGEPLSVSKRTIYKDSFNEINATDDEYLEDESIFSWYDNDPVHGMSGDWICVANLGEAASPVSVFIGSSTNPAATFEVEAGGHHELLLPDTVTEGPVRVVSGNGQRILASQRVIYRESFTELPGVPASQVPSESFFSFYDNNSAWGMNQDWILIANMGESGAQAGIFIGDMSVPRESRWLEPGESFSWQSPKTLHEGPVKITSPEVQPLLVSQRVIYKDSFEEIPATGRNRLDSVGIFNWYDSVWMKSWIMLGRTEPGGPNALISISHDSVYDESGQIEILPRPCGTASFYFPLLLDGPVGISFPEAPQDKTAVISQRVIYKNSFNELPAVYRPLSQALALNP